MEAKVSISDQPVNLLRLSALSASGDLLNCLLDPLAHPARSLFAHPSLYLLDLLRHPQLDLICLVLV
jgi:hypothetical protein